jgi:hypothetical protein
MLPSFHNSEDKDIQNNNIMPVIIIIIIKWV